MAGLFRGHSGHVFIQVRRNVSFGGVLFGPSLVKRFEADELSRAAASRADGSSVVVAISRLPRTAGNNDIARFRGLSRCRDIKDVTAAFPPNGTRTRHGIVGHFGNTSESQG